jgi:hypothetical protein
MSDGKPDRERLTDLGDERIILKCILKNKVLMM